MNMKKPFFYILFVIVLSTGYCIFYGPTALIDVFERRTDEFYLICEFKANGDFVARAESGGYGEPPRHINEFKGTWDLPQRNIISLKILRQETILGNRIMSFASRYKYRFPEPDILVLSPLDGDSDSKRFEISLSRKRTHFD